MLNFGNVKNPGHKCHKDRAKIIDFLLMINFGHWRKFLSTVSSSIKSAKNYFFPHIKKYWGVLRAMDSRGLNKLSIQIPESSGKVLSGVLIIWQSYILAF